MLAEDEDGRPTCVITSLGLRVDNDIEVFNELRELSLRVLSLVGGRYERASGLVLPVNALPLELEAILRRAIGLATPAFRSTSEMAAAVLLTLGTARPRGAPRSQVHAPDVVGAADHVRLRPAPRRGAPGVAAVAR